MKRIKLGIKFFFMLTGILLFSGIGLANTMSFKWEYSPNKWYKWRDYMLSNIIVIDDWLYVVQLEDNGILNFLKMNKYDGQIISTIKVDSNVMAVYGPPKIFGKTHELFIAYPTLTIEKLKFVVSKVSLTSFKPIKNYSYLIEGQLTAEKYYKKTFGRFGFIDGERAFLKGDDTKILNFNSDTFAINTLPFKSPKLTPVLSKENLIFAIVYDENQTSLCALETDMKNCVWTFQIADHRVDDGYSFDFGIHGNNVWVNFKKFLFVRSNGKEMFSIDKGIDYVFLGESSIYAYFRKYIREKKGGPITTIERILFKHNISSNKRVWQRTLEDKDFRYPPNHMFEANGRLFLVTKNFIHQFDDQGNYINKLRYSRSKSTVVNSSDITIVDDMVYLHHSHDGIRLLSVKE